MRKRAAFQRYATGWIALAWLLAGLEGSLHAEKDSDRYRGERERMVLKDIKSRGVTDKAVLDAMASVPRHEFVPDDMVDRAYADRPLPIGHGQTISQPYIVAAMTEMLGLDDQSVVLEVGTGPVGQAEVSESMLAGREVEPEALRYQELGHEIGKMVGQDSEGTAGLVQRWIDDQD